VVSTEEILKNFPAPEFRKYQKQAVTLINNHFNSGGKVVILEAPTGLGKSLINATFTRTFKSFYVTPQLTLIDQILNDRFLAQYFVEIKGRQNYWCTLDPNATCDVGLCQRLKEVRCDKLQQCPYYMQKAEALVSFTALMSFAYFILEGRVQTDFSFGRRDLSVIDECHNLEGHVVNSVNLIISPYAMPYDLYMNIRTLLDKELRTQDEVKALVNTVMSQVEDEHENMIQLTMLGEELSIDQAKSSIKLNNWKSNATRFLETVDETEWVWQHGWVTFKGRSYKTYLIQPLYARPFTKEFIWNRSNKFILSSATILDPQNYVKQVGLDLSFRASEIKHIKLPSIFPVENRPILDKVIGKLTYKYRDENMGIAVRTLEMIMDIEEGVNVAVHCVSYQNAQEISDLLDYKYNSRIITQVPGTRKEALEDFLSGGGKVFLSVAYTEGQDWAGELCEAQVLFKVPYMYVGDKRVARRLEKKEWKWYRLEALKQVIQSYGRAVRSKTDVARYYVIDESFIDLLKRTRRSIPSWFAEALPPEWRRIIGL